MARKISKISWSFVRDADTVIKYKLTSHPIGLVVISFVVFLFQTFLSCLNRMLLEIGQARMATRNVSSDGLFSVADPTGMLIHYNQMLFDKKADQFEEELHLILLKKRSKLNLIFLENIRRNVFLASTKFLNRFKRFS